MLARLLGSLLIMAVAAACGSDGSNGGSSPSLSSTPRLSSPSTATSFASSSGTVDETLDKFIGHVKAGEITKVDVSGDTLTYKLKGEDTSYTTKMESGDTVRQILVDAGVKPGDANYPDVTTTATTTESSTGVRSGDWQVEVIRAEVTPGPQEFGGAGPATPKSGYEWVSVQLGIQNASPSLKPLNPGVLPVTVVIYDDRGFKFAPEGLAPDQHHTDNLGAPFLVPPGFAYSDILIFQVPSTATLQTIGMTPNPQATSAIEARIPWNDAPTAAFSVAVNTDPASSMGTPFDVAGVARITPLKAELYGNESNTFRWWDLFLEVQIDNLFGYDLSTSQDVSFEVFTDSGAMFGLRDLYWAPDDVSNQELPRSIAPGQSGAGMTGDAVTSERYQDYIKSGLYGDPQTTALRPDPPSGLYLVVILREKKTQPGYPSAYKVFRLTDLPILRVKD